jgi:hypothetical protein
VGDPIPLWRDASEPPPEPGRYLVISRLYEGPRDGDYVVQSDVWSARSGGWDGGISDGEPLPGSVVAWAEEP